MERAEALVVEMRRMRTGRAGKCYSVEFGPSSLADRFADYRSKARRSRTGDSPGREGADGSSSKRRRLSMDGGDHEEEQMDLDDEPEETLEDARREYEANEARRQAEAEAEMLAGESVFVSLPPIES